MPEYRIDAGNSNTGPIGFVAYVHAGSEEEALELFKEASGYDSHALRLNNGDMAQIYFNPSNITLDDVEECDED